jgi:hypothetical protein
MIILSIETSCDDPKQNSGTEHFVSLREFLFCAGQEPLL